MTARRGVALTPMETRRDVIVRSAVLADRLGYELFVVPEGWGLDSTLVLTEIALRTTAIRLASGVLSVWGRTPATLAMSAATLHQVSGGRYILGLGASTQALAAGFHGVPFEHPARKLRDTVAGVRALLAGRPARLGRAEGGPATGAGAARPLRLGQPPAPEVPIWVAALGEHTLRVAAELADGWFPAFVTRDSVPAWVTRLSEQRAPGAPPLTIVSGPVAAAGESAAAARDVVATCLAWYLAAMGDIYRRVLSGQGYAAEVEAILAANPRPSPRHGTVPPAAEPLLSQLTAYGTVAEVREQVRLWDKAADITTLLLPPGMSWPAIEATLLAAAPDGAPEPGPGGGLATVTNAAPTTDRDGGPMRASWCA